MIRILFLATCVVVLNGCVKTRAQLRGDEGGTELQKQTNTQRREEVKASAQKPPPPPPPASKTDEIFEQLREMNGRIDTLENQMTQVMAAAANEKLSTMKMAEAIDQKFAAYEEEIKKLEAQVLALTSAPAPVAKGRTAYDDGEDAFNAKKWKEAIVNYQKYRDANPKGKMYADATYKIGVCFQELKLKDEARAFFDEVIAKYPGSKEAKKAAFRAKQAK